MVQRGRVTIVLLHDPTPERFAAQMAALARRYTIVSLESYLAWRANGAGGRMPPKSLIVTFDDGHRGNAALLETIRAHQLRPTIFLCSGIVGTGRHFWFEHGVPNGRVQELKRVPDDVRLEALARFGYSDEREFDEPQALTSDELELLGEHVDLQAHTVTHPILPMCSDEKAEREIGESKRQLEAMGLVVNTLSYPNGDYGERELAALDRAGYVCGVTVDAGYNDASTDLRRLRRMSVDDGASATEMIVKASGLVDLAKSLKRRVARRRGSGANR